jgi:hypothetical protein
MNARLTHVPLAVSDQDPALKYYTRKVGFEKRAGYKHPAGARWLTVAPKGSDVEFALIVGNKQARGVRFGRPGNETPQARRGARPPTRPSTFTKKLTAYVKHPRVPRRLPKHRPHQRTEAR